LVKSSFAPDGQFDLLTLHLDAAGDSGVGDSGARLGTALWCASVKPTEFKEQYEVFNSSLLADDNAAAAAKLVAPSDNPDAAGLKWNWTFTSESASTLELQFHDGRYSVVWRFTMRRVSGSDGSDPLAVAARHVVLPFAALLAATQTANRRARGLLEEVIAAAGPTGLPSGLRDRCRATVAQPSHGVNVRDLCFDEVVRSIGSWECRAMYPVVGAGLTTAVAAAVLRQTEAEEAAARGGSSASAEGTDGGAPPGAVSPPPQSEADAAVADSPPITESEEFNLNSSFEAEKAEEKRKAENQAHQKIKKKRKKGF
jgi:hypothetical protein